MLILSCVNNISKNPFFIFKYTSTVLKLHILIILSSHFAVYYFLGYVNQKLNGVESLFSYFIIFYLLFINIKILTGIWKIK